MPSFPEYRPRRLRRSEAMRSLVRETRLHPGQLVLPLFARSGIGTRIDINSMPGVAQLSVDLIVEECRVAADHGVGGVLLFGIPDSKNATGSSSWDEHGPVQRAVAAIKRACPTLVVTTDVCLCEYTDHGHCGVLVERDDGSVDVDNDASLELLARQAVSHANAGADIVAPSDMMDGRVGAIRAALDASGLSGTALMSYAAKFASPFYGPFREAAESTPKAGDRRGYQMDSANSDEALREVELDIDEGADIVMVKPAGPCLDVIYRVKSAFGYPLSAYQVSGEYAMMYAAAQHGWIDLERAMMDSLLSIRRAGADFIITYFAIDAARVLARGTNA